ncbi:ATP synthase F1 subunit delta [Oligoflexus tunisiensis]|uniref:ATP synthase F1 subunit delta n=1 Tax=Oligoflexus tunisiensis TaxID=708132 RepID=UPI00114D275D|nr:ATP synthase F1 subunit delta [Oligoflexus tunisiensis]
MSAEKIAHRYATALLSLTEGKADVQDKITSDLAAMAQLYDDKAIRKIIASPIVNPELLQSVFNNVTEQLKSPDVLKRFLGTLVESKRTALLPTLAQDFKHQVQKSRGIVDATVTSAVVLNEAELKDIRTKLESMLGKRVNLLQSVDKSILGGFEIRIENSVLDMTLKTKLEHMTKFAVS